MVGPSTPALVTVFVDTRSAAISSSVKGKSTHCSCDHRRVWSSWLPEVGS